MKIFPKEIIENTSEVFRFKHTTKSKLIYSVFLITISVTLISLPFIDVDIYTSSAGIVKPDKNRVSISLINSGRVKYSVVENNKEVEKGDTLLIIESKVIDEKLNYSKNRFEEIHSFIRDLNYLTGNSSPNLQKIKTSKYQTDFLAYEQKLKKLQTQFNQLKIRFDRNKLLFDKGVIASAEFEAIKSKYDLARTDIYSFKRQAKNSWQIDLTKYKEAIEELSSKKNQLL